MTPKQARLNNLSRCLACGRYGHPRRLLTYTEYHIAKKKIMQGKADSYPGGLCRNCRRHTVESGSVAYELMMRGIPKGSPEALRIYKQHYRAFFRYSRKHKKLLLHEIRGDDTL